MNDINSDVLFERLRRFVLPSKYDHQIYDASTVTFPVDLIAQEEIGKITRFFEKADLINREKAIDVFIDIDNINRVKMDIPSATEVVRTVEAFVGKLLDKVTQIDPRFKSNIIRAGSFYDGVKIGKPDEFDFTAKIDSLCITEGLEARFSSKKKGFVYVVVTNQKLMKDFREFFVQAEKDAVLLENEIILSVDLIQSHFRELIDQAVNSIDIPEVLLPEDEKFSWSLVQHGPCATIYATLCSKESGDMKIDIDIAPTFDFPNISYRPPVLDLPLLENQFQNYLLENLLNNAKIMLVPFTKDGIRRNVHSQTWSYEYSNTWRVSFNALEKAAFSLYDADSVEKQIYRILKIFKETYMQKSEKLEEKAGTYVMKLDEPPSTKLSDVSVEVVGFSSSYDVSTWNMEPLGRKHQSQEHFHESGDYDEYSSSSEDCQSNSDTGDSDGVEVLYDRLWSNINTSYIADGQYFCEGTQRNIGDGHSVGIEVLYERPLTPKNSSLIDDTFIIEHEREIVRTPKEKLKEEKYEASIEGFSDFCTQLEYRSSKPLIKTYHLKMILFSMMMVFPEKEIWKRECLPLLVLLVVKILYYIHSSKYRVFNNFWFQEIIESDERLSVSKEVVQSLNDLVDDLKLKTSFA